MQKRPRKVWPANKRKAQAGLKKDLAASSKQAVRLGIKLVCIRHNATL